jgi:outer membrane protein assembly factor BamD
LKTSLIARISVYFICLAILASCSPFTKLQKTENVQEKYAGAVEYYKKKDYYRAGILFEELIPLMRGQAESELTQFYYSYCQFYQGQLTLAAYYFKKFFETYPRSENAEEAMFMYAMSLYEDSPKYNLDQTNTHLSIDAIQVFVNRYPQSKYVEKCNKLIDECRAKLEMKAYEGAKLFYNMREYKSALILFENFKVEFPESNRIEELRYLRVVAQLKLAKISVEEKKKERFEKVKEFYEKFVDSYASSKYVKPLEDVYDEANKQLDSLLKTGIN